VIEGISEVQSNLPGPRFSTVVSKVRQGPWAERFEHGQRKFLSANSAARRSASTGSSGKLNRDDIRTKKIESP